MKLSSRQKKEGEESVQITIPLFRSGSEYPRDVLDGLLLSIKESAPKIDTEIFLKVSTLIIMECVGTSTIKCRRNRSNL